MLIAFTLAAEGVERWGIATATGRTAPLNIAVVCILIE